MLTIESSQSSSCTFVSNNLGADTGEGPGGHRTPIKIFNDQAVSSYD